MQLLNFDIEGFLRDSWQKKPLLLRGAWDHWSNPLEPDELAGLAGEEGVESRLVTRAPDAWELEHGPVAESRFGRMGKQPWTLLVQAVDHYVPAVADLLRPFRFIPNWRVDDVMVSYAVDGGGVGAHFDQYDVFLVQGLGKRRWRIGQLCDADTPLLAHDDLRLLANFEPTEEWVLEPGDILYVPPRFAHDGIAVGDDCMTYSIGFRAPSRAELISPWADSVLAELTDDDRYADPDLHAQANPGEISPGALERLHRLVAEKLLDRQAFARWFGRHNSLPKNSEIDWRPEAPLGAEELARLVAQGAVLLRNSASRFSFIREDGGILLFAEGEAYDCTGEAAALAERLCAEDRIEVGPDLVSAAETLDLVAALISRGNLALEP